MRAVNPGSSLNEGLKSKINELKQFSFICADTYFSNWIILQRRRLVDHFILHLRKIAMELTRNFASAITYLTVDERNEVRRQFKMTLFRQFVSEEHEVACNPEDYEPLCFPTCMVDALSPESYALIRIQLKAMGEIHEKMKMYIGRYKEYEKDSSRMIHVNEYICLEDILLALLNTQKDKIILDHEKLTNVVAELSRLLLSIILEQLETKTQFGSRSLIHEKLFIADSKLLLVRTNLASALTEALKNTLIFSESTITLHEKKSKSTLTKFIRNLLVKQSGIEQDSQSSLDKEEDDKVLSPGIPGKRHGI